MVVWLLLTAAGTTGLLWAQRGSRAAVVQRFQLRVGLMGDFVTSYVADLIDRERVQAAAPLTAPVVDGTDFVRSVAGFGYPSALLLDAGGRVLHAVPDDRSLIGKNLTIRYAHLRIAAVEGRPAVSPGPGAAAATCT